MAMKEILESVRRIIHKWVNTITPLTSNITAGDEVISVDNVRRFERGDQIMIKNSEYYEVGLFVEDTDSTTQTITLSTPVLNSWVVSPNTTVIKTIGGQIVQGIYLGDPDAIMRYPAITVNGVSRASEWLTLESTKERYEIEIGVFVKDSTHEQGYDFLMTLVDTIQLGLKRNVIPMIYDAEFTTLKEDFISGGINIIVNDSSSFGQYRRIFIEDESQYIETWIDKVYEDGETVKLKWPLNVNFSADSVVTVPHRFVYNSWPSNINYGKIHKGELLKGATISWFAEEQETNYQRRDESRIY